MKNIINVRPTRKIISMMNIYMCPLDDFIRISLLIGLFVFDFWIVIFSLFIYLFIYVCVCVCVCVCMCVCVFHHPEYDLWFFT